MAGNPHTKATQMAMADMRRVIDSFDIEPFMADERDPRTIKRERDIASAAPDLQALDGTLSKSLLARLARLDGE